MKEEKSKNRFGFKLIIGGIILCLFCVLTSVFWYKVFQKDKVAVATLTISLKDSGKGINVKELTPLNDRDAKGVPAYSFDISNSGDSDGRYEVLLEDSLKRDSDGYQSSQLLTRDQLKYELILNGKVIASDLLSTIEKNTLDIRTIAAGKKNTYQLRIWIPLETQDWQNKTYHYKVVVNPVSEEE